MLQSEITEWIKGGCPSPAPLPVKMSVVNNYVRKSGSSIFIETGTLLGGTVEYIASRNPTVRCHSIEIEPKYYSRAVQVLKRLKNVELILGDSSEIVPSLLECIAQPAVFWLDGHYSGGYTGRGASNTPVSSELEAILNHDVKRHIILIDDARLFTGEDDYPTLTSILNVFENHQFYRAEISVDIIRITPR